MKFKLDSPEKMARKKPQLKLDKTPGQKKAEPHFAPQAKGEFGAFFLDTTDPEEPKK